MTSSPNRAHVGQTDRIVPSIATFRARVTSLPHNSQST